MKFRCPSLHNVQRATGQIAPRKDSWSRACKCKGSRLTPLCCRERPSRCTLLEREGLHHDRKVADAQSGLHGAAWRGYPTILDILLGIDGVDVDGKDEEGYTALFLAAR